MQVDLYTLISASTRPRKNPERVTWSHNLIKETKKVFEYFFIFSDAAFLCMTISYVEAWEHSMWLFSQLDATYIYRYYMTTHPYMTWYSNLSAAKTSNLLLFLFMSEKG